MVIKAVALVDLAVYICGSYLQQTFFLNVGLWALLDQIALPATEHICAQVHFPGTGTL